MFFILAIGLSMSGMFFYIIHQKLISLIIRNLSIIKYLLNIYYLLQAKNLAVIFLAPGQIPRNQPMD